MTDSTTPELILAVQLKNIEKVRTLLESEEVDVNVTDSFGDTALHFAAALNQLEILKLLVEKGAKVNAQNNTGATPLHKASARDNRQIILHLLPLADITIKTNSGLLAEQFASDVEVWKTIIGQNNLKREKIFIENDNLGTLIGKKGRNLQQLQTTSNTRIIVHSKNSSAESGTTEVSITGREESIAAAKQLIEESFKPKPSKQEQIFEDDDIEHSVKVAAKIARNKYGRIIGAKGKKITEIEDTFSVKVVLPKFEDDEVVTIYGDDSTSVQDALNFIFELIKDKEKPNQDNRNNNNNQNRNNNNNNSNNSNSNNNNNNNNRNRNNNNNNGDGRRNNSNNNNPRSSNPKSNSSAQVIKTKDTVVIKTNNYLRANGK